MAMVRRLSALALVVAMSLVGLPIPAHAAEESPVVSRDRVLTIQGQPLSQLRNLRPGRLSFGNVLAQEDGQISGVALDGEGEPLAEQTVRLTRIVMVGGQRGEQVGGTAMTDGAGRFSFTGLRASDYLVDVVRGDEVVASASATLADGAMQVSGVTVSLPAVVTPGDRSWVRRHPVATVFIGVGVFFVILALACSNPGTNVCAAGS